MSEARTTTLKYTTAGDLEVAYREVGPETGTPVMLLHGFPYDIEAFSEVGPIVAANGGRVLTPYLRGFGPTRFLSPATMRSGQQGALAHDLLAFMDALAIPSAILAGYDWGGRAACIVAALWPQRVNGLVSVGGYNIQDIPGAREPLPPESEFRYWYQYYFHGERGRIGLARNRRQLCRLLWALWSPNWAIDDATFDRTATAFDNADFVDVVVHSYRHRFGLAPGDPRFDAVERQLESLPSITVPSFALHGAGDGVTPAQTSASHDQHFAGPYARQVVPVVGHNLPQEAPREFAAAVIALLKTVPAA